MKPVIDELKAPTINATVLLSPSPMYIPNISISEKQIKSNILFHNAIAPRCISSEICKIFVSAGYFLPQNKEGMLRSDQSNLVLLELDSY